MTQLASLLTAALLVASCGIGGSLFASPSQTESSGQSESSEVVVTPADEPVATTAEATQMPTAPAPTPVPVTTPAPAPAPTPVVVPIAQPTTMPTPIYQDDNQSMDRVERRQIKAQRFAASLDSLVMSRAFVFLPNSMQEIPGGWMQMIYNQFYYVGVMKDHVEVHLPVIRGTVMPYYEILNFDTFEVKNYQASRAQFGWNISFNLIAKNDLVYTINIMIYSMTGETVMNLLTVSNTIRYVGYLQPASQVKF